MKHPYRITTFFLIFFLLIHAIGLFFTSVEAQKEVSPILDAPQPVSGAWSIPYLLLGVGIGTGIILLLAKYGKTGIWKGWFTTATALAITYGVATVIPDIYAIILGITLALLRLLKPSFITHNVAELFMYGGIALILTPLFTPITALILFAIMSVYDAYAVWKSKHMITLAEFTKKANTFPGLSLSYNTTPEHTPRNLPNQKQKTKNPSTNNKITTKNKETQNTISTGVLGGGDILFPLLLANTVYLSLIPTYTPIQTFLLSYGVSIAASTGLAYLFLKPSTAKYHPALPYIFIPVLTYTTTLLIIT